MGSSRIRDHTHVSALAGRFWTTRPPGKPQRDCMLEFVINQWIAIWITEHSGGSWWPWIAFTVENELCLEEFHSKFQYLLVCIRKNTESEVLNPFKALWRDRDLLTTRLLSSSKSPSWPSETDGHFCQWIFHTGSYLNHNLIGQETFKVNF